MRTEKKQITSEYVARLNASPFFIVVDYKGLGVSQFTELRKRLRPTGAEVHVIKNSIFRIAAKEAGVADLDGALVGQLAAVTGQKEITAAAKVLKTFESEFDKPKLQFGYLENRRLDAKELQALADLPSMDVMRGMLLGVINAPATRLVRILNTPGSQLARVIQAKVDKG